MLRAVFFDFDGVIHNTFRFHLERVHAYSGVQLSEDEYRDMHNGNFYADHTGRLKDVDWLDYNEFIRADQTTLEMREDMKRTLQKLGAKYALYVVSSGSGKNISMYLENNGVRSLFLEVLGNESVRSKSEKFKHLLEKYALSPEECVFVTDTLGDILEAQRVPLRTVAVDFGYHGQETLRKGNPYKIVSDVPQLLAAIEEA